MRDKNETAKYRLAESMHDLLEKKPVKDIRVTEICETCGVSRQTFYRNFLDKNDLINWYFDILLDTSFEKMGDGKTVYDGLIRKFRFIKAEGPFFAAAFNNDEQNNLKDHDFRKILSFYTDLIQRKAPGLFSEEMRKLLEMYCQASIYGTVRWILGGMKSAPEELAALMIDAMPAKLAELFRAADLLR